MVATKTGRGYVPAPAKVQAVRGTIAILLLCSADHARAQDDPARAVNDAFDGRVRLAIDKDDQLVVDHHNATGMFRQDVAYLDQLDPGGIAWSAEEGAILLRCLPTREKCIAKEIFKTGAISPTGRMTLRFEGDEAARERTMAALAAWITAEQARIAQREAETNTRPQRKK